MWRKPESGPVGPFFEPPPGGPAADVATATVEFGFDLLRHTVESGRRNTVVSPFSIAALLAMTGNGARGERLPRFGASCRSARCRPGKPIGNGPT